MTHVSLTSKSFDYEHQNLRAFSSLRTSDPHNTQANTQTPVIILHLTSMAEANVTVINIDSKGDVLFPQDFTGSTKLLVSSKVLAQASDVFKTMMDHLGESIRLHIAISQLAYGHGKDLYTLPLPVGGSEEASILFLNVLHHQTKDVPQKLSLELVLDIGFICHNFHCADAFKPWSAMWLAESEPEAAGDLEQSCQLLVTAHIFDDANSFSRISGTILLERDGSFSTLPEPNWKMCFPWESVLSMSTKLKMFLH